MPALAAATVRAALDAAAARLAGAGLETARLEAEELLAHALGLERLDLYVEPGRVLSDEESARYASLVERRASREPLQHVRGFAHFYGRAFRVDGRVLVPRLETEILTERALEILRPLRAPRALDLGTGSGNIAVTLACELAAARVVATDIDADALEVARANAETHGVAGRVALLQGDLFGALPEPHACFDLVAMNPPYVTESERAALSPEVREREPAAALFVPDAEPLVFYERLAENARDYLAPGGFLLVEAGDGRAGEVMELFAGAGLAEIRSRRDLAGVERVVEARRPES
jgi:release factor glutamine methyltransferase